MPGGIDDRDECWERTTRHGNDDADDTTPGQSKPGSDRYEGYSAFRKAPALLKPYHQIVCIIFGHLLRESYPSAEMQSVYSTATADYVILSIHWYTCKNIRIGFELTKKRSRMYPVTTITDADYADDITILVNTPDQAETLLHSLERAAASIGLYVNAHKTEYMCYNQTGDISTLEGTPLKLVDKFTYLGSSVESTEKDIKTRLAKAWTAINRL